MSCRKSWIVLEWRKKEVDSLLITFMQEENIVFRIESSILISVVQVFLVLNLGPSQRHTLEPVKELERPGGSDILRPFLLRRESTNTTPPLLYSTYFTNHVTDRTSVESYSRES